VTHALTAGELPGGGAARARSRRAPTSSRAATPLAMPGRSSRR